ncbi:hypothetical protein PHMEG_00024838 [Phytophthora megakarya]|uniref:Uncharacterized protein n=1 Tax=Phytophthora megakarya TaxID=4795 RepID=A0A225VE82_9STRA|nr:hypothetical protein PHMEG_00024838 [Phytophthora megakarya]
MVFLRGQHNNTKAYGTVVKMLKRMHAEGNLNDHIIRHHVLTTQGRAIDTSHLNRVHGLFPQYLQSGGGSAFLWANV